MDKNTDYLAEAYEAVSVVSKKAFHDNDVSRDTYEFLKTIQTQINLYRVAVIKK